jgi:hypothetical protein
MKTLASLAALSLVAAALTTNANAAITGSGGMTTFLAVPPANAQQFNLTGATAYCWDEQSNVTSSATLVNLSTPGTYTGPGANLGVISGNFDSHFIHFDPSPTPGGVGGSVTFSAAIRGVIYDETLLSNTDGFFGAGGTTYDTGNFLRSNNSNALGGNVITYAGNTINFQLGVFPGQVNRMVEIRVLTDAVAPTPGTSALAVAGTLLATRRRRTTR